jgi:hypothetical protein
MVLRKALDEAAEALKRLFGTPKVRGLMAPRPGVTGHGAPLLGTASRPALEPLACAPAAAELYTQAAPVERMEPFEAILRMEEGWAQWASEARVTVLGLFRAEGAVRLQVPPLPSPRAARLPMQAPEAPAVRVLAPRATPPRAFRIPAQPFALEVRKRLAPVLRRPFAFDSEDVQKLPKALWMRYSLALVKATGENVRNLEVLGLWRIPRKGMSGLRPEAGGRLWVQLSAEAAGADRAAFMVARKKDDQSLVSAFVE